jgi:hypothetical protein
MLEQLPELVYAQTDDTVYANLYVGNHASVTVGNRSTKIVEDTRYPWDGDVSITLDNGETTPVPLLPLLLGGRHLKPRMKLPKIGEHDAELGDGGKGKPRLGHGKKASAHR